jgi:putative ABC transport system permease protein
MLKNYLKIARRSLVKNRLTSLINIIGLATGMCGTLLIGLYVFDEFKYDQHFRFKDRIYRLSTTYHHEGSVSRSALTDAGIAGRLIQEFPEVQTVTRLMPPDEAFLFSDETAFKEDIIYTDSAFTNVFAPDMLLGSKDRCLKTASSVIISESTALKLFGDTWKQEGIVGKILSIDNKIPLTITGVFRDLPDLTHFKSNLFATVPVGLEGWMSNGSEVYTYVLLRPDSRSDTFFRNLERMAESSQRNTSEKKTINGQPLTEIHLYSSLENDNAARGNINNLYALLSVAFFLILITTTNFVNLFTANCLRRLKEIGVRKATGASSAQLRWQFFCEAVSVTILSALIALTLVAAVIPLFNDVAAKSFTFRDLISTNLFMLLAILVIVVAFLASLYPLVVLSGTKTQEALKGVKRKATSASVLKKALVGLQFAISTIMIILSIVAFKQVRLINSKSLGFDKKNTVTVANPYMLGSTEDILRFKRELSSIRGIEDVSITGYTPSQHRWGNRRMTVPGRDEQSNYKQVATWLTVDEDFISTMALRLVAGRNFLPDHETDKDAVIINRKAVSFFNLDDSGRNPVGAELSFKDEDEDVYRHYTVVGVVDDFNFGSLHESIGPIAMTLGYHRFEMVLRLSPAYSKQETLSEAQSMWSKHLPVIPFEYSLVEDRFKALHKSDVAASDVFSLFCVITVIMSAFGLFGVVTYIIGGRTKEIGIRKLLGGSEAGIAMLLAREFIILVALSYAVALPVALIFTRRWLADFAFKTQVSWWVYGATALILLFMAVATLGVQSVRAALANPVDNLRSE